MFSNKILKELLDLLIAPLYTFNLTLHLQSGILDSQRFLRKKHDTVAFFK